MMATKPKPLTAKGLADQMNIHTTKRLRKSHLEKMRTLQRRAAGRMHYSRKKSKRATKHHFLTLSIALAAALGLIGLAILIEPTFLPPKQVTEVDVVALERVAAANRVVNHTPPPDQVGIASWYAAGLAAPDALTCASTRFPRGTRLLVTNLRGGKQVVCLVNDYGPVASLNRAIDLSRGSFTAIGNLGSGTIAVEIRVVH